MFIREVQSYSHHTANKKDKHIGDLGVDRGERTDMYTEAMPLLPSEVELTIQQLLIKKESFDTTIIQLKGKLIRTKATTNHIVIALHAKNKAGQYIHLQQYEFDYMVDQTLIKEIDISVLVLSDIKEDETFTVEVKVLTELTEQQWKAVQRYSVEV